MITVMISPAPEGAWDWDVQAAGPPAMRSTGTSPDLVSAARRAAEELVLLAGGGLVGLAEIRAAGGP